jgi:hypothetical protein
MKEVVAYYSSSKKAGMTTCGAIRATTVQFVDVPRTELAKILVEQCQVNPSTARTQIQAGRKQASTADPAPVHSAAAAQPTAKPAPARAAKPDAKKSAK